MQMIRVGSPGPDGCKHPPAAVMVKQCCVTSGDVINQHRLVFPSIGETDGSEYLDAIRPGGLRNHPDMAAVFQHERVGQVHVAGQDGGWGTARPVVTHLHHRDMCTANAVVEILHE